MERVNMPWCIILIKFKDSTIQNSDIQLIRNRCENLFTGKGAGTLNMVEYFLDMSHGKIDIGNSTIVGVYTLNNLDTYGVNGTVSQEGSVKVIAEAKQKAMEDGVSLTSFNKFLICGLGNGEIYGLLDGDVYIGSAQLFPSEIGHEMGHGFGLDHARISVKNLNDDYMDPTDIMSVRQAFSVDTDKDYTYLGPGINAASMRYKGWLDESRVFKDKGIVQIRPLHHRHLEGYLAIEFDGLLVEYRIKEKWDANFPSCVLIHDFSDKHSYSIPSKLTLPNVTILRNDINARYNATKFVAGDRLEVGTPIGIFSLYSVLEIVSIDDVAKVATIRIIQKPGRKRIYQWLGNLFGGIEVDGGGFIVRNGKFIRVPPRSPLLSDIGIIINTIFRTVLSKLQGNQSKNKG